MVAFNSEVYLDIGKLNISGLGGSSEGETVNVNGKVNVNLGLKGFLLSRSCQVKEAGQSKKKFFGRFIASTLEQKMCFYFQ